MSHFPVKIKFDSAKQKKPHANPDPFVLRWKNEYFCYSSGEQGVYVLHSKDLMEFKEMGFAYENQEEHSFWAPDVFYWKGMFYLYYSSLPIGETDDHLHFLRVAASKHPLGPFQPLAVLTDYFAIDPHVFSRNDHIYMLYAANIYENQENGRIGTVLWMDELSEPDKLSGKGHTVLIPTLDQEIFARNRFGDGKDWHTLEGPCYLSDGEESWILYSGNAYTSPDYFIGYAVGQNESDMCRTKFRKKPGGTIYQPLVSAKNHIEGTGHNSVTQAPDHITPLIVYHGRKPGESTDENGDDRKMYLDALWRKDSMLVTDAPSAEGVKEMPAPDCRYLEEKPFSEVVKSEDHYQVHRNFSIILPEGESIYMELCVRIPEGKVELWQPDGKKPLMVFQGDYWQHGGILFSNGQAHCRYGEEWKKPFSCEKRTKLEIRVTGTVYMKYLDGTLLQDDGGAKPRCLL